VAYFRHSQPPTLRCESLPGRWSLGGRLRSLMIGAGVALSLAASIAEAQSQSPPAQTSGGGAAPATGSAKTTAAPLTVTAKSPDYRRSIDRRSYNISNDVLAANGSIADALRNVPSVDVDPQGVVSLRGDSSVTILVDGQPAPMFQGQGRAELLRQLPASQYERVEVMTNPSAGFRAEGTGGIINLVTKKSHKAGQVGSVSGTTSTLGREHVGFTGLSTSKDLTLHVNTGFTYLRQEYGSQTLRQIVDPASGQSAQVTLESDAKIPSNVFNLSGGAALNVGGGARLTADLGFFRLASASNLWAGTYRSSAATGPLAEDYDNTGASRTNATIFSASSGYVRDLGGDDHEVSAHLSYFTFSNGADNSQSFAYQLPVQPNLFQDLSQANATTTELTGEYKGPLPGAAKLVAGYDFEFDRNDLGRLGRLGATQAGAVVTPSLTDQFDFQQGVYDGYVTYQRPFGRLTVMPGLRLEAVQVATDQVTTAAKAGFNYFEVYPTLHLAYQLDDANQLTASYSRRVQRPSADELNPYRIYSDPLSYTQGNPYLRPELTNSYEVDYEYTKGQTYYQANGYYRDTGQVISDLQEDLGGGATLSTYANSGHSRNAGVELVANGAVGKTLTYSLTGDVFWNQITATDPALEISQSGASATAQLKLNWTPTPNDFVQLSGYASGKRLTAQGYTAPFETVNLGYRRHLTKRLFVEATLVDPFDTFGRESVVNTPALKEDMTQRFHIRALSLGFTYDLGGGGAKPAPRDFDFGSGDGGGGGAPH
jgi:outer membrane receptor protein involved in Fe transport